VAKRYLKMDIAPSSLMCRAISDSPLKEPVITTPTLQVGSGNYCSNVSTVVTPVVHSS
jgi:hypothetical protein